MKKKAINILLILIIVIFVGGFMFYGVFLYKNKAANVNVANGSVSNTIISINIDNGIYQNNNFSQAKMPVAGFGMLELELTLPPKVAGEMPEEPAVYWGYHNLGIANVGNHLNIRSAPSEEGAMLGKMSNNDACEILDTENNWAHVISGDVEGYVCMDYLLTGPLAVHKAKEIVSPVATITSDAVRVREAANTECAVITLLQKGEELNVIEQQGDWYQIDLDNETAYVYADFVSVEEKLSTGVTMEELYYGSGVNDTRIAICQYAQQFIGNPYVWGGTSLTKGADCSGFTMAIYSHYGIKLPHHSGSQAKCGKTVNLSDVKPGDLIFYTRGGAINHVAIYIGNGQVCHASSPKTGIKVSNMYYRTPYKAVSLLN